MKARDFVYWFQGFFEIQEAGLDDPSTVRLTPAQVKLIRNHLNMVFAHEIDPSMGDKARQGKLNSIHAGVAGSTNNTAAPSKLPTELPSIVEAAEQMNLNVFADESTWINQPSRFTNQLMRC